VELEGVESGGTFQDLDRCRPARIDFDDIDAFRAGLDDQVDTKDSEEFAESGDRLADVLDFHLDPGC
jgi:hypothetical protein